MKPIRKIKAFTISEMIVVLILTSIVVGIAFTVLSLVQKHMISIQANLKQNTTLNKLETSLWLDFNRYSSINYNDFENELHFCSDRDSIYYQFHENYIVKDRDTFDIPFQTKKLFFSGSEVDGNEIDAMKLTHIEKGRRKTIFVFKQNDAKIFLK